MTVDGFISGQNGEMDRKLFAWSDDLIRLLHIFNKSTCNC